MPTANEVLPLQALHYDPQQVDEIGKCLAQPYDVAPPLLQAGIGHLAAALAA